MAVGMIFNPYTAGRFGPRPPAGVVGRAMSPASVPASDPTLASALATPAAATPRPVLTIGPESDALAKALLAQASQGEVRTPFEALGKLAQLGVGTWAEDKFQKAEKDRETAPWTAFRDAMASGKTLEQALAGSNDPKLLQLYAENEFKKSQPKDAPAGYQWGTSGGLEPIPGGPADVSHKTAEAPAGYRWGADGSLEAIPGGPAVKDTKTVPYTDAGKIKADLASGLIGDAEAADALNKLGQPKPADIPTDQQNYDRYANDEKTAGRQPQDFNTWLREIKKIGASQTSIDLRGENAEATELGKQGVQYFADIAKDSEAADQAFQTAGELRQLLQSTDTGPDAALSEWVRKTTGFAISDQADKLQAVSSLLDYLTPRMRVPGSGATSDMEMRTFKNSLPTLLGTPEGNQLVMSTIMGLAQRRVDRAAIAQDYLSGSISKKDAIAQMRALPDVFGEFKAKAGAGAAPAIPQNAIDALKADPTLRDQFEQKYGPGSAAKALGK